MIEIIYGIFVTLVGVYVGEIVIRRLIDVYIEIKDKLSKQQWGWRDSLPLFDWR